jgi:tetratricopeptide (TPR) repeat protein
MLNLIDIYDSALFLGAVINTLEETFPHIYIATMKSEHPTFRDTFVIAAGKRPFNIESLREEKKLKIWTRDEAEKELLKNNPRRIVLTDDFAPVENLLAPVVRLSTRQMLAMKYLDNAKMLKANGDWHRSIKTFKNAASLNPTMSVMAYNEIGVMQGEHNDFQEAARAFQKAIDYYNSFGTKNKAIGPIGSTYLNMGLLLLHAGQNEASRKYVVRAVEEFHIELQDEPNSALVWSRLGEALGTLGDFKAAAGAFDKAATFEPENLSHRYSQAQALEFGGLLDEAIEVARKAIESASRLGQQESTEEFNNYIKSLEQKKSQAAPKQ